ncbi:MAG: hypothetical protein GXP02_00920 [Alphaproteobacteria bacterium]|nr:hypothetical protein [Alphaproteobacteria bacterium]
MNVFEMVVLIVFIGASAGVLKSYFKRKNAAASDSFMDDLATNVDTHIKQKINPCVARINALEQRIQILERIVTDKNHNLAAEIDSLK